MIQQIPLRPSTQNQSKHSNLSQVSNPITSSSSTLFPLLSCRGSHVLLVLGLTDNVKGVYSSASSTILGQSWQHFFSLSGVSQCDVWTEGEVDEDKTLWTAKLFPVVDIVNECDGRGISASYEMKDEEEEEEEGLGRGGMGGKRGKGGEVHKNQAFCFDERHLWLAYLSDPEMLSTSPTFKSAITTWKQSRRISLADILLMGDAASMHLWRQFTHTCVQQCVLDSPTFGISVPRHSTALFRLTNQLLNIIISTSHVGGTVWCH